MSEFRIPAVDVRLGDEVELHEGDPIEPLLRMPHHVSNYWVVAELAEGGVQLIEQDRKVSEEDTIIAVCVRKMTAESLELPPDRFRLMLIRMGVSPESDSFQITRRCRFVKTHVVKVRRAATEAEAEMLRRSVEL
jgi:hypothetical protein